MVSDVKGVFFRNFHGKVLILVLMEYGLWQAVRNVMFERFVS